MPELPDIVYQIDILRKEVLGRKVVAAESHNPIVVRNFLGDEKPDVFAGTTIDAIDYRGPFFHFHLGEYALIVNHMLAGYFKISKKLPKAALVFHLELEGGVFLSVHDKKQMAQVYVGSKGIESGIARYQEQGVPIFSDQFTEEYFLTRVNKARCQVRVFVMDNAIMSSVGNAYADEILFDAGIHPKTKCYKLKTEEKKQLYTSVVGVMRWGVEAVAASAEPIEKKVRGHVKVRNRKKEPCPVCGTTIRRAQVLGYDVFFCPECQPDRAGGLVDWTKLPGQ